MKIVFRSRSPDHRLLIVRNTDILQILLDQDRNEFFYYENYTAAGYHLLTSEWEVYDIVA